MGTTPSESIVLRANGISKTFRMGDASFSVWQNLDMDVFKGEFVAIEGRSGTGKSTLLHVLAGLDRFDDGTILLDGQSIGGLPDQQLSKIRNTQFGFVFQFYFLLPELNVLENVMLAPMIEKSWLGFRSERKAHTARATELLEDFNLGHRLRHKVTHLSGGERQRVAIARALMNKPRILFADEPTGNLDVETGQQIMTVLEKLHREQGQTIVMVTHDRAIAKHADRVMVLDGGKLREASGVTAENK